MPITIINIFYRQPKDKIKYSFVTRAHHKVIGFRKRLNTFETDGTTGLSYIRLLAANNIAAGANLGSSCLLCGCRWTQMVG